MHLYEHLVMLSLTWNQPNQVVNLQTSPNE